MNITSIYEIYTDFGIGYLSYELLYMLYVEVISAIKIHYLSNTIFTGGIGLGIIAYIGKYFKHIYSNIIYKIKNYNTYVFEVNQHSLVYLWIIFWLNKPDVKCNFKKFRLYESSNKNDDNRLLYGLSEGKHSIYYKGYKIRIDIVRRERYDRNWGRGLFDDLIIALNNKDIMDEFINECEQYYNHNVTQINIKSYNNGYWEKIKTINRRSEESFIINPQQKIEIYQDIEKFLNNKERYERLGIPHKRSYLLYGKPGCGKSTFIHICASKYDYNDIYYINLTTDNMDDQKLCDSFSKITKGLLVIEDIDTIFDKRNNVTKSMITFSRFINCMDGLISSNVICFITTNDRTKLDDAMLRCGRIDKQILFTPYTSVETKLMFERFFPSYESDWINDEDLCIQCLPSNLQEFLIVNIDNDLDKIKRNFKLWLEGDGVNKDVNKDDN